MLLEKLDICGLIIHGMRYAEWPPKYEVMIGVGGYLLREHEQVQVQVRTLETMVVSHFVHSLNKSSHILCFIRVYHDLYIWH